MGAPFRRSRLSAIATVLVACAAIGAGVAGSGLLRGPARLAALPAPSFADETASAGIDHAYGGGFEYAVGGGVAAFDCDGDRKPDLYLAGGANGAALYRNDSPIG